MLKSKIVILLVILLTVSGSFAQSKKKGGSPDKDTTKVDADINDSGSMSIDPDASKSDAVNFLLGGVFGAVTIDGKNYQQIGLRPELKLWKLGIGLDIDILLDEDGRVREEEWNEKKDIIDKIYYVSFGAKGEPFYFKYGGLEQTTLGFGTIIKGYTNLLEYPTYKRQGLELSVDTKYVGMEVIVNDFKELSGKNPALMTGGRLYIKPFSRLQIGGSIAGDFNEYKGLRDTDDDGYPDEVDMYPENDNYVTEIDYFRDKLGSGHEDVITALVDAGLISPIERTDLMDYSNQRSKTGFWAVDAGLKLIDAEYFKMDIYAQYSACMNTGGWGYTAPGIRIKGGSIIEIYGDYRQQSDEFIFGYYNDTYDLERAKYVDDGTGKLYVETKKDKLKNALASRGYFAGLKLNLFDLITGTAEYQDLRWGEDEKLKDKSLKGELALKEKTIPLISKAKAYYVQNNVTKIEWKTESTVIGGVVGLALGEKTSVDFKYLITFEDKNGDGEIKGRDEQIRNVSVSTTSTF